MCKCNQHLCESAEQLQHPCSLPHTKINTDSTDDKVLTKKNNAFTTPCRDTVAPEHNPNTYVPHQQQQRTSSFRIEQRMYMRNPSPSIAREVKSVSIINAPSTAEMHTILLSLFIRIVFAAFCIRLSQSRTGKKKSKQGGTARTAQTKRTNKAQEGTIN
jgi:hypothetical protein